MRRRMKNMGCPCRLCGKAPRKNGKPDGRASAQYLVYRPLKRPRSPRQIRKLRKTLEAEKGVVERLELSPRGGPNDKQPAISERGRPHAHNQNRLRIANKLPPIRHLTPQIDSFIPIQIIARVGRVARGSDGVAARCAGSGSGLVALRRHTTRVPRVEMEHNPSYKQ